jgi:hypothetical protein
MTCYDVVIILLSLHILEVYVAAYAKVQLNSDSGIVNFLLILTL